jgi:hypothetical protein
MGTAGAHPDRLVEAEERVCTDALTAETVFTGGHTQCGVSRRAVPC